MNLRASSPFPRMLVLASVLCAGHAAAQCPDDLWIPSWSDEFDGTSVDWSRWHSEVGRWPYNAELESYQPWACTVAGGMLTITSTYDTRFNPPYVSGRIRTRESFLQLYGRFEMRAKLPSTRGIWPAFWLLPADRWPPEIDIMEMLGHDPTRVYFSNHWGVNPNVAHQTSEFAGADFSAGFHTFAVEWYPDRLDYFVDGVKRATHRNAGLPNEPMYIILNTAVGGQWPGNPDASTVFPQRFVVDYVRAYRQLGPDQSASNVGFEDAPLLAGWGRFGNGYAEPFGARTGARAGKLYGNFTGSANSSGLYQDCPAAEGQLWAATAWFMNRSDDRLQGANSVSMAIEWRSASDQLLRTDSTTVLTASSPLDVWMRPIVSGRAPANTARARLLVRFTQPALGTGAAFFDDVVFGPVNCPRCGADYNQDGGVDGGDVEAFYLDWEAGAPAADLNADGGVDGSDVESFFVSWERGGC